MRGFLAGFSDFCDLHPLATTSILGFFQEYVNASTLQDDSNYAFKKEEHKLRSQMRQKVCPINRVKSALWLFPQQDNSLRK